MSATAASNATRVACRSIFNGRFYPTTFMQQDSGLPQWPAGRFTVIDAVPFEDVCGTDDGETDDTRIQIDIVANTHNERATLEAQVIVAMMGITDPPCVRDIGPRHSFDEPTRTFRSTIDFLFHASSEVVS